LGFHGRGFPGPASLAGAGEGRFLCAALGLTNSSVELPNRWATELDLFGDFVCDIASGDRETNAYTLIELEPALEYSIFMKLQAKKIDAALVATLRAWLLPTRRLGMENFVGGRVVCRLPQDI
jgi:hypothetical protein